MDVDKLKIPTFETVSDIPYESPYLCWECQGEQYWDRDSGIISLIPQEKLNDLKSVSSKGVIDKSMPLQEEEEILQRQMLMEQAKVNRLKQKYLLDLLN